MCNTKKTGSHFGAPGQHGDGLLPRRGDTTPAEFCERDSTRTQKSRPSEVKHRLTCADKPSSPGRGELFATRRAQPLGRERRTPGSLVLGDDDGVVVSLR